MGINKFNQFIQNSCVSELSKSYQQVNKDEFKEARIHSATVGKKQPAVASAITWLSPYVSLAVCLSRHCTLFRI